MIELKDMHEILNKQQEIKTIKNYNNNKMYRWAAQPSFH
jgi:hypothetical protein